MFMNFYGEKYQKPLILDNLKKSFIPKSDSFIYTMHIPFYNRVTVNSYTINSQVNDYD